MCGLVPDRPPSRCSTLGEPPNGGCVPVRRSARRDHRAMVTRRVRGAKAPARSGRDRGDRVYWFPNDANPQDVTALRSGDGMLSMAGGVAIYAVASPWCCSPRGRRHSPDCERAEVPGREPTLSVTSLRRRGPADATGGGTELVHVKGRSEPSTTLEAPKTRGWSSRLTMKRPAPRSFCSRP